MANIADLESAFESRKSTAQPQSIFFEQIKKSIDILGKECNLRLESHDYEKRIKLLGYELGVEVEVLKSYFRNS
jgi:hypothetical protein